MRSNILIAVFSIGHQGAPFGQGVRTSARAPW